MAQYGSIVNVFGKKNILPVADAGKDRVVSGNASVTLDGTNSYDSDGNVTSYHWLQTGGEPFITLSDVDGPNPSFIAPANIKNDTNILFQLIVTDNDGGNSTDDMNVLIKNTTLPKIQGTIILEPVPRILSARQIYEFKGLLNLSSIPEGSYIQIRNGKGEPYDELITFGPVNKEGKFVASWTAEPRDELLNIHAAYVDISGNTFRSEIFPVKVMGFASNPGQSIQNYQTSTNLEEPQPSNREPFIEIHYNEWDKDSLNVYVMSNDPSSQKYIHIAM
jgi:hypothetical protein